MKPLIGMTMVAAPFVALFVFFAARAGVLHAAMVFGGALAAAALILFGIRLVVE